MKPRIELSLIMLNILKFSSTKSEKAKSAEEVGIPTNLQFIVVVVV